MIQIGKADFRIFGLEIAIATLLLIITLIYGILPGMMSARLILPKKPRVVDEFFKYHSLGWNQHFNYYIDECLRESGTQIILGFVGSILVLFIPFFFSTAGYFTTSFFLSGYLFKWSLSDFNLIWIPGIILVVSQYPVLNSLFPKISEKAYQIISWGIIITFALFLCAFFLHFHQLSIILPGIFLSVIFFILILSQTFDKGKRHWFVFAIIFILYAILILSKRWVKSIEIAPGVLSRLYRIQASPLPHSEFAFALTSIVPLLLLWISPILSGLESLDSKFSAQTTYLLRWLLQHLRKHTVLFGYGDLGKKVAEGVVKRVIIPKASENFFIEILSTRRQEFVDICANFVVVDKNPGAFDETHPDPDYGIFGICDIELKNGETPVVLLGLVGDCKEPGIHDNVNLEFSKIVILAARDEDALFPIYNEVYKLHESHPATAPSAIIGVERGLYASYLEWRCVNKDIYFVYPALLRGITIGEVISDIMIKLGMKKDNLKKTRATLEKKKILIFGRGAGIFFTIRCLHEDLMRFFYSGNHPVCQEAESLANKFLQENVALITDDEYFKKIKSEPIQKLSGLNYCYCFVTPGILAPSGTYPSPFAWRIPLYFNMPTDSWTVEEIINRERPEIIIISSQNSLETARITQEVLHGLERINSGRDEGDKLKPHLIVGSRRTEWYQIRDAMAWWRSEVNDIRFYPLQQIDTVVDFYDDAGNMIISLYESLSERRAHG